MKVLLTGHMAKLQIVPLTSMIRKSSPDIDFEVGGDWLSESDGLSGDFPKRKFPDYLFSPVRSAKKMGRVSSVEATTLRDANGTRSTPGPASLAKIVSSTLHYLRREVSFRLDARRARAAETAILNDFDIVNLHSVAPSHALHRRRLISHSTPLVVSMWGSDVLRKSDIYFTKYQQETLEQATLVTYTTNGFKEAALAKYGRHLEPKFRETFFSPNFDVCSQIAQQSKSEARRSLISKHNIPENRVVLCLGHNASPDNQHLQVIESLARESTSLKEKVFLLVPMTYCQIDPNYLPRVRMAMQNAGLAGVVLHDFMSVEDIVELRKGCDGLIYVPISDVFSATVSQALIGQQVVISGSWLPYEQRRRAGFRYWEVDSCGQVGSQLTTLLGDWGKVSADVQSNQEIGLDFFAPKRLGGQWVDVYREAIEIKGRN